MINPDKVLFEEISALIEQGRHEIMSQASRGTVLIFWQIGNRINSEILDNKRADYGKQIVSRLATQLAGKYGRSFELRNLRRMMQFAELTPQYAAAIVPFVPACRPGSPPAGGFKRIPHKGGSLTAYSIIRIKLSGETIVYPLNDIFLNIPKNLVTSSDCGIRLHLPTNQEISLGENPYNDSSNKDAEYEKAYLAQLERLSKPENTAVSDESVYHGEKHINIITTFHQRPLFTIEDIVSKQYTDKKFSMSSEMVLAAWVQYDKGYLVLSSRYDFGDRPFPFNQEDMDKFRLEKSSAFIGQVKQIISNYEWADPQQRTTDDGYRTPFGIIRLENTGFKASTIIELKCYIQNVQLSVTISNGFAEYYSVSSMYLDIEKYRDRRVNEIFYIPDVKPRKFATRQGLEIVALHKKQPYAGLAWVEMPRADMMDGSMISIEIAVSYIDIKKNLDFKSRLFKLWDMIFQGTETATEWGKRG